MDQVRASDQASRALTHHKSWVRQVPGEAIFLVFRTCSIPLTVVFTGLCYIVSWLSLKDISELSPLMQWMLGDRVGTHWEGVRAAWHLDYCPMSCLAWLWLMEGTACPRISALDPQGSGNLVPRALGCTSQPVDRLGSRAS